MDKDRIAGAAKQAKGTVKEAVGKVVGDAKLKSDGKSDKAEGKVQNAIGGVKDAVRDALKKSSIFRVPPERRGRANRNTRQPTFPE